MTTNHLKIAFKYFIGLGILALILWWNWKPGQEVGLWAVYQQKFVKGEPIHYGFFALEGLFCLAAVLLTFIRWYFLVRAQRLPFSFRDALRLGFFGYFCNTVLPGSVGGDIAKAIGIAREQSRRTVAVATVLIDRAVGLWGLGWLVAILGSIFWAAGALPEESKAVCEFITTVALASVGASLVVWVLLGSLPPHRADRFAGRLERLPGVGHSAAEFWRAVWIYRVEGRGIWIGLVLSLIGHVGFVMGFYCAARTIYEADQIPSLTAHFLLVPIGMAVQAGIPTPGGVGGGEAVFGLLYRWVGFDASKGLLMSLVNRFFTWILGLVGYVIYLQMRPALHNKAAEEKLEQQPLPV